MALPLAEFFAQVYATDLHDYGAGDVLDFLDADSTADADLIITNPPFNLAAEFARVAIRRAKVGAAMLVRTTFIEGVARHRDLFSTTPPAFMLQFTERVPMHRGRLLANGSTATAYAWIVWLNGREDHSTRLEWLPPCRKRLELASDYQIKTREVGAHG